MSALKDFEPVIILPDMSQCRYGERGWAGAWRDGWTKAVAACNLEMLRRIHTAEARAALTPSEEGK